MPLLAEKLKELRPLAIVVSQRQRRDAVGIGLIFRKKLQLAAVIKKRRIFRIDQLDATGYQILRQHVVIRIDNRIEISFCRAADRDSRRLATLAHTMSSTSATTALSMRTARLSAEFAS